MKDIKTISIQCDSEEKLDRLNIAEMTEFQGGLKTLSDVDCDKVKLSLIKYGFSFPFFVWRNDGKNYLIDGHQRMNTLCKMQKDGYIIPDLPVVYIEAKDEKEAKQKLLRLNSQYGKMTKESVLEFADDLEINFEEIALPDTVIDFSDGAGTEETDNQPVDKNKLTETFLVPPLSILDSTQGYWQERKKQWKALGIKSDEGRDDKMLQSLQKLAERSNQGKAQNESIFDPVLCEILYSWFCKKDGVILDPFTGGSVRGIVASFKDMKYTGFDIRTEQIEANEKQIYLCDSNKYKPKWICSDSNKMNEVLEKDYQVDFVFSCPPYADLEVYSDLEDDLSNMEYEDFRKVYFEIIKKSCSYLKDNRFACFVVGECRDKKGNYYNFVSDTIKAFEESGLHYYNEIILKTNISAKALTCGIGMKATRKVGKIHQNVLVFIKGNPKQAAEDLGQIEVMEINEEEF